MRGEYPGWGYDYSSPDERNRDTSNVIRDILEEDGIRGVGRAIEYINIYLEGGGEVDSPTVRYFLQRLGVEDLNELHIHVPMDQTGWWKDRIVEQQQSVASRAHHWLDDEPRGGTFEEVVQPIISRQSYEGFNLDYVDTHPACETRLNFTNGRSYDLSPGEHESIQSYMRKEKLSPISDLSIMIACNAELKMGIKYDLDVPINERYAEIGELIEVTRDHEVVLRQPDGKIVRRWIPRHVLERLTEWR